MKVTNAIFKLMLGTAVLILSVSTLIFASKPASAGADLNQPYLPVEETAGGKYTLQYAAGTDSNGYFYWHMVVFNRQSGAYKAYTWNNGGWEALFPDQLQLPALP